jgi:hypothetical protein
MTTGVPGLERTGDARCLDQCLDLIRGDRSPARPRGRVPSPTDRRTFERQQAVSNLDDTPIQPEIEITEGKGVGNDGAGGKRAISGNARQRSIHNG